MDNEKKKYNNHKKTVLDYMEDDIEYPTFYFESSFESLKRRFHKLSQYVRSKQSHSSFYLCPELSKFLI